MIKPERNLQSIGALSDIAAEVDGITNYVRVPKPVKWSNELRRERLRLFGGVSDAGKVSKTEAKADAFTESLPLPEHVKNAHDIWPYVSILTEYIETKTGQTLGTLFTQKRTAARHYVKAFAVIMRFGFGVKRSIIVQQIGTTKQKLDSVLTMYRDALYYSPNFTAILNELLDQLQ